MNNYYEKPKDWGVAPKETWVSGTPVGQSEVRMPNLGDPGSHENVSSRVSFGDDDGLDGSFFQGRKVSQCPPGMSKGLGGMCTPNPQSEATLESRQRAITGGKKEEEESSKEPDSSLQRELPSSPKEDPQISRIRKEGYKGR